MVANAELAFQQINPVRDLRNLVVVVIFRPWLMLLEGAEASSCQPLHLQSRWFMGRTVPRLAAATVTKSAKPPSVSLPSRPTGGPPGGLVAVDGRIHEPPLPGSPAIDFGAHLHRRSTGVQALGFAALCWLLQRRTSNERWTKLHTNRLTFWVGFDR